MEERDPIDDVFKDRADQQSFDVPDSFLKDLDSRLNQMENKKKRRGFWWLLLMLPIVIFSYLSVSNDTDVSNLDGEQFSGNNASNQENNVLPEDSNFDEPTSGSFEESNDSVVFNQVMTTNDTFDNSVMSNLKNTNEVIRADDEVIRTHHKTDAKALLNEITLDVKESRRNPSQGDISVSKEQLDGVVLSDQQSNSLLIDKTVFFEKEIPEFFDSINPKLSSTSIQENKLFTSVDSVYSKDVSLLADSIEDIPHLDSSIVLSNVPNDAIEMTEGGGNRILDSIDIRKMPIRNEVTISEWPQLKKWKHDLQLFGGFMNSLPSLSVVSVETKFPMASMESSLWSALYGFSYHAELNHFDFGTGLSYEKTGEQVNYITNTISILDVDSTFIIGFQVDSIFNENSETWELDSLILYADTSYSASTIDTALYSGRNVFNWITIPLHFGYQFDVGPYRLIPRLGIDLGFAIGSNTASYAELVNEGIVSRSSKRFVLSSDFQLEIRRNFDRYHVFITPYFKSNLMSVISSDVQRRRYHSWGINGGIGFRLNP